MPEFDKILDLARKDRLRDQLTEIVARRTDEPEESLLAAVRIRLSSNPTPLPEVIDNAAMLANEHGRFKIVTELLSRISNPKTKGALFFAAAVRGDDAMVNALFPKTGERDLPLDKPHLMLMVAGLGRLSTIKILHQRRFPLSQDTAYGTAYHAAINGHRSVVEYLLENGADPMGAILGASTNGNKEIAQLGLDRGARVENLTSEVSDINVYASRKGLLEFLRWMHEDKKMPLAPVGVIEAANQGRRDILEWMVSKGLDPNFKKGAALEGALQWKRHEVVAYLRPLRANAKPEDADPWLDIRGRRAPSGLENEYPYNYDITQFESLSRYVSKERGRCNDQVRNAEAFRLLVLFGSSHGVAEYVVAWGDSLQSPGRPAIVGAANFKLPIAEGWDQKAWGDFVRVNGPPAAALVEHALLLPLGPNDTVEETRLAIQQAQGNRTRAAGVVPGMGGGGAPGHATQMQRLDLVI
jgi:ankyrin repeat protein